MPEPYYRRMAELAGCVEFHGETILILKDEDTTELDDVIVVEWE